MSSENRRRGRPILRPYERHHFVDDEVGECSRSTSGREILRSRSCRGRSQIVCAISSVRNSNDNGRWSRAATRKKPNVGDSKPELRLVISIEQHQHWKTALTVLVPVGDRDVYPAILVELVRVERVARPELDHCAVLRAER